METAMETSVVNNAGSDSTEHIGLSNDSVDDWLTKDHAQALHQLGMHYTHQGCHDKAYTLFQTAYQLFPDEITTKAMVGFSALACGKASVALKLAEQLNSDSDMIYHDYSQLLMSLSHKMLGAGQESTHCLQQYLRLKAAHDSRAFIDEHIDDNHKNSTPR